MGLLRDFKDYFKMGFDILTGHESGGFLVWQLDEANREFSQQERTCFYRAEAWMEKSEPGRAIPEYRSGLHTLTEQWPYIESPRKWLYVANLGLALIRIGQLDEAIDLLSTLLQNYPDYAIAFNYRGWAYLGKNELAKAEENFQEAIRCDPHYENAYQGLRKAQEALLTQERAAEERAKAKALTETFEAHYLLGIAHLDRGDPRSALEALETALRIAPEHSGAKSKFQQARHSLARLLTDQGGEQNDRGEHQEALGTLTEALRLDSGNAVAFNERGLAYLALGALDKACADFDEAIRLDPDLGLAYKGRAVIHHKHGDLDKAIADLHKGVRCDPEECEGVIGLDLADLYCERAETLESREKAIDDYTAAMSLDPKDTAAILRKRGDCYLRSDRFEQGVADFTAAAKLDPLPDTGLPLEKLLERPLAHVEHLLSYETLRPGHADWKKAVVARDQFLKNDTFAEHMTITAILRSVKGKHPA